MADITLVNLNMLFMRYGDQTERELHVPLGCLYLTGAMERAGFEVDFRDYQTCDTEDPFDLPAFLNFLDRPAGIIGLSCMANLLPFTIVAARELRRRYPDAKIVLGGVGTKGVEGLVLERFGWIDIICRGEGELTGPDLLAALRDGRDLSTVPGISFRSGGGIVMHNADRPRVQDLDSIPFPVWDRIDLSRYAGYGMMTSRGCPYPCTFCSVAPAWNLESHSRSPANIVQEMALLHERAGVELFLFQDEFFVSSRQHVVDFCDELNHRGLKVKWKAFGRVNLVDEPMMQAMADCGCVELRFGIESGCDEILRRLKKGFTAAEVLEVVPKAINIFPRVDAFYIWGFPFETMDQFNLSLFQMVSLRMMGARILPSLLSLLPQTEIYRELAGKAPLEFCPWLLPEFVFTGHEICHGMTVEIPPRHREYFDLIQGNADVFPGFFHVDLAGNVLPKLKGMQEMGFYPATSAAPDAESCGAHSPRVAEQDLEAPR
ncbi:MAG: radical SAM protein [Planctomycetaceae bacterium]|nr:B12-binding domain-containing radical SAM protein [Planctomycetaceae bacterium]